VGFVGNDNDVFPEAVGFIHQAAELVDQAEHIPVVIHQELFQPPAVPGLGFLLVAAPQPVKVPKSWPSSSFRSSSAQRCIWPKSAVDLLGQEDHGIRLARSLGIQKTPSLPAATSFDPWTFPTTACRSPVDAQVLVIPGHDFLDLPSVRS